MLRSLAMVPALVVALSATSVAAGLECLNSKPCGNTCIARNKVCHPPPHCPRGYYLCGKSCTPKRILCRIN